MKGAGDRGQLAPFGFAAPHTHLKIDYHRVRLGCGGGLLVQLTTPQRDASTFSYVFFFVLLRVMFREVFPDKRRQATVNQRHRREA